MIIDMSHPDVIWIKIYDKNGNMLPYIQSVDTDTMIGSQTYDHLNGIKYRDVKVYKITGPNIYFERKKKSKIVMVNRNKKIV